MRASDVAYRSQRRASSFPFIAVCLAALSGFGLFREVPLTFAALPLAEKHLPECVHWTAAFVFTEYMERGKVKGSPAERLYLHPENPQLCDSPDSGDCKGKAYVIPGDTVTIGNVCGAWAYVEYRSKRSSSRGWVELDRLNRVAPPASAVSLKKTIPVSPKDDPLAYSAAMGDIPTLKRILTSGRKPKTEEGIKALYYATAANRLDAVHALLEGGVDPRELSSSYSCDALRKAVTCDSGILKALIKAGANVNCSAGAFRETPLMAAASVNRATVPVSVAMGNLANPRPDPFAAAKLLIAAGADLNAKNAHGETALRHALEQNNVDIAELLLKEGADANNYIDDTTSIGVQSGNTALLEALFWYPLRRDPSMLRLLLQHRADVNYRNSLEYDEYCDKTTSGKCTFQGQTALTRG